MQELKFETSEEFQEKVNEFVQLLQTLTQSVTGVSQPHKDLVEIGVVNRGNPFGGREIYSVYRNTLDNTAHWCKGRLDKPNTKDIKNEL